MAEDRSTRTVGAYLHSSARKLYLKQFVSSTAQKRIPWHPQARLQPRGVPKMTNCSEARGAGWGVGIMFCLCSVSLWFFACCCCLSRTLSKRHLHFCRFSTNLQVNDFRAGSQAAAVGCCEFCFTALASGCCHAACWRCEWFYLTHLDTILISKLRSPTLAGTPALAGAAEPGAGCQSSLALPPDLSQLPTWISYQSPLFLYSAQHPTT